MPIKYVHIGYGKTATTTLQNHLFGRHPEILNFGRPYEDTEARFLARDIIYLNSIKYDHYKFREFVERFESNAAESGKIPLFSEESFLDILGLRDFTLMAGRIKEAFGPCRIIVTMRNQVDLIKSYYISRGRIMKRMPGKFAGRTVTMEEWLDFSFEHIGESFLAIADFNNVISLLEQAFGKDNIGLFLFEEFQKDRETFIKRLSEFIGVDYATSLELVSGKHEKVAYSQRRYLYDRIRQSLFPNVSFTKWLPPGTQIVRKWINNFLVSGGRADVEMPEEWRLKLIDLYRDGNTTLAARYDLPFEKYGYFF